MRFGHYGLCVLITAVALTVGVARQADAAGASVAQLQLSAPLPHFVCAGHGVSLSRAAYTPPSAPAARTVPLPCCDGQLACAQFLSTTTILHGPKRWRG